ncbi:MULTISPECIES: hypothetical protein [Rhodococcus]|uniref:Uncharacterized protein n=1 Tax=Rhodococcus oxybenzonivorans TaxID=1990687 RepID=A0AAE5A689_9NOCA|nr:MULTISPECIES: hypothetical protein [Rhodococcus]MDV7241559.1 hypothetical protein [Rhodococcus oxybenzonivorans]MDV7264144.1 hypothetical protein [Rhodococcus oxybenzonivorans]MDV7273908.1 hypothetical protein [Rhodococcus oxybenzonivorans]MDV7333840.1 hypothetical protein [Rhodococcus oxybenzonivorans]MDV7343259.1 hypothetical protein [Rhodococcus oxybenzonivorans]
MGRMPSEVMQHELDMLWQSIFTWLSWVIVAIMLAIAFRMCVRQRTPFYLLACLAAGIAAFAEPLYDVAFDLWFYDVHNGEPGAMYSHFTAFGVVQPNWSHSGYIILYASACLYAGRRMYEGSLRRKHLFLIWVAEIITSCVFEIIGTGTNVYTYYGPYELRIWNYPLVIGVLEGTQVVLFTVLAVQLWRRVSTAWGLIGLLAVFPVTMFGANFGLGAPIIIALHLEESEFSSGIVWAATLLTMTLCTLAVNGASKFLPRPFATPEPDGAPARKADAVTAA